MKGIVYGVGINDANYQVQPRIDGIKSNCKFYSVWSGILERCYSEKFKLSNQSYQNCVIHDSWVRFMSFKSWMEQQDWHGKQIDKDLLVYGNKVYGPDTCVFIDKMTNNFIRDNSHIRGKYLIGVYFHKTLNKFRAQCANTIKGKNEHIGYFENEVDAHLAWKKRKHELACQLADLQTDERVANALRTRYL